MDRIELHTLDGVTRLRAWATGNPAAHDYRKVEIGTLPSGAFYARHSGKGAAYIAVTERAAYDLAAKWLSVGEWRPTPASFNAKQQPDGGGDWVQRGGDWFPADD